MADTDRAADLDLEVDFLGDGSWPPCERISVPAAGHRYHIFPAGFSAHWLRITTLADVTATAEFVYT